jgi:hypothetical protein
MARVRNLRDLQEPISVRQRSATGIASDYAAIANMVPDQIAAALIVEGVSPPIAGSIREDMQNAIRGLTEAYDSAVTHLDALDDAIVRARTAGNKARTSESLDFIIN